MASLSFFSSQIRTQIKRKAYEDAGLAQPSESSSPKKQHIQQKQQQAQQQQQQQQHVVVEQQAKKQVRGTVHTRPRSAVSSESDPNPGITSLIPARPHTFMEIDPGPQIRVRS